MPRIGLVVLDVRGTTVRDTAAVAGVFMSALQMHGIVTSPEELRERRGASKREVIEDLVRTRAGAGRGRGRG